MPTNTAITPECTALLERVQQVKRLKKLSADAIAKEACMYRPTVQNQLSGRYNLDIRVVLAIARLCPNISCDWLLRGEGQMLLVKTNDTKYNDISAELLELKHRLRNIEQLLTNNKNIEQT